MKPENETKGTERVFRFLINCLLVVSSIPVILSGLVLQVGFHMNGPHGPHGGVHAQETAAVTYEQIRQIDPARIVWGYHYSGWSSMHKISIAVFSLLMICHIAVHRKWYAGVIRKRLIGKNREAISLTVLFLLVALTGIIPWLIDLSGSAVLSRMAFIEIHDKITFLFIALLFLHMIRRSRWFVAMYRKLM